MKRLLPITLALVSLTTIASAADAVVPSIRERFAPPKEQIKEVPDFRQHIVPMLGKLGCNGRACHGSFQGQGGFRLSLFGYDFKMDHDNLTAGDSPRINVEKPEASLAIEKPTMVDPHEGGLRYKPDSWEHKIFLRWIEGGAKGVDETTPNFVRLDVTPSEIQFQKAGETTRLKVIAVWSNGTREDVTTLCRFQSNSSSVAEITKEGLVTAVDPGDTHVVISYDKGVVPIPVIRPVSELAGAKYPQVPTPTKVDELVVQKLTKLGIVPSELANDAEFLRRVSLDMTGTLPTPWEVEKFLADPSPDKRARKIDELLETPAYAAWWTTKLCDITGNNDDQLNNVTPVRYSASAEWYDWIHKRVSENVPYDDLVEGIVLSKSRNKDEDFETFSKNMSELYHKGSDKKFAEERETMPHYWVRRNFRQPDEKVIGFAYTFLGLRIQCAQCHKHPFDQWTQDDFKEFTGFFTNVRTGINPDSRDEYNKLMESLDIKSLNGGEQRRKIGELVAEGKVIPFQEVYSTPVRAPQASNKSRNQRTRGPAPVATAKLLGGENVDLTKYEDSREPLMAWLRSKDNPYFARAFVNRVWAGYFNVGIVNPPDDLSLANPPSNKALLDHLTEGFIDSGFDMKWVHREIANSRTYQLTWTPNETNRLDEVNFSHQVPRRLPAEAAYDAIAQATASDETARKMHAELTGRAIAIPGAGQRGNRGGSGYALSIFGRSIRESNCDCDRSSEASLLQTVFLQNDSEVLGMIDNRNGWLAQVSKDLGTRFVPQSQPAQGDNGRDNRIREAQRQLGDFQQQLAKAQDRIKALKKDGKEQEAKELERKVNQFKQRIASLRKSTGQPAPPTEGKGEKLANLDPDQIVKQAYLRTLSRYPTSEELERSKEYVTSADETINGVRGLLWALVNTKEFIVNH